MNVCYDQYKTVFAGLMLLLSALAGCDYTTSGEICNHMDNTIEIVIYPYQNSEGSVLNDTDLKLVRWDTASQTGYFNIAPKSCALVATGINSFSPQELIFTYVEIRTLTDTAVFDNQFDIHLNFKEYDRHSYVWVIE